MVRTMLVVWAVVLTFCTFPAGNAQTIKDIKLFDVVNLTKAGVNETEGYHSNSKAYEFTESVGALIASPNASELFAKAVNSVKAFSIKAYLQTPSHSNGGAITFFSRGKGKRGITFNVIFNWAGDDIAVDSIYQLNDNAGTLKCAFESSYLKGVARDDWMHLTVLVNLNERLIRCTIKARSGGKLRSYYRNAGLRLATSPFDDYPVDGEIRLAQQQLTPSEQVLTITDKFVGKLQDVVISFGDDSNCTVVVNNNPVTKPTATPAATTSCPTMPAKDDTCIGTDNTKHADGKTWNEGKSTECSCHKGKTLCIKTVRRCVYQGIEYIEGDTWDDLSSCDQCKCEDGASKCRGTQREFRKNDCAWTCADDESKPCPSGKKDGCFCKKNEALLNGRCVNRATSCPCTFEGKVYSAGLHTFFDKEGDCQLCNCGSGTMSCDQIDGICD